MQDRALFIGGFVPSLVFGVAVGNLFLGAPFRLDDTLRVTYEGNFFGLLTPFPVLAGLISVGMLVTRGRRPITMRTSGEMTERARCDRPHRRPDDTGAVRARRVRGAVRAVGLPHRQRDHPDRPVEPAAQDRVTIEPGRVGGELHGDAVDHGGADPGAYWAASLPWFALGARWEARRLAQLEHGDLRHHLDRRAVAVPRSSCPRRSTRAPA